ncbi:MAG: hypothetical protein ABI322_05280 [Gemmatimonadaceae bacterium]
MRTLITDTGLLEATLSSLLSVAPGGDVWMEEYVDPANGTVWRLTYLLG